MSTAAKPVKVLGKDIYYQPKTVDVKMLLFLYRNGLGRVVLHSFLVWKWFSDLYAMYHDSKLSIPAIQPFIKDYDIDLKLYEQKEYRSFNDFFIRKFKSGSRKFVKEAGLMPAFCEAFYMAWSNIGEYEITYIKGQNYTLAQLFGDGEKAAPFLNGPLILARLAPYHYHWFHFIDDGPVLDQYHIPGKLHSVDPIAIGQKPDILFTNKRDVTIVETNNFGKIAYIEVGALTVGRITQLHRPGCRVERGDAKGYFSFGGSTVLIIGQRDAWMPLDELLTATNEGVECSVLLGQAIAQNNAKR